MPTTAATSVAAGDRVTSATPVRVGLIGHGIQRSRTPKMHVDEGRALGIPYKYDLIDTALMPGEPAIADLLDRAEAEGYRGVNVTHPFKQQALKHLDEVSDAASAVGAVNTVVFRDGRRHGHNTDYWGFAEAFRRSLGDAPRDQVLLLGAGGAGGAVAQALADLGVTSLVIHDPERARAETLAAAVQSRVPACAARACGPLADEVAAAAGIVNASPIGMATHPGLPVPAALLTPRHWVADIVYFPLVTEFLATARAKGCRVMDGSGMAVFQAVRAFTLFTGQTPDPNRMRATFDAFTD